MLRVAAALRPGIEADWPRQLVWLGVREPDWTHLIKANSLEPNTMEITVNLDDIPEIPAMGEPEFDEALTALVRSADVMRKTLMLIVEAKADPERVLRDHGEVLLQSEAVIQA